MFFISAQGANASTLNVDAFVDYTSEVQAVISQTESNNPTSISQCCNYKYQILDQYCATQTMVRLPTMHIYSGVIQYRLISAL